MLTARDFAHPVVILPDRKAVIRAPAAGREVWCAETGEGFFLGKSWNSSTSRWTFPGSTLNYARRVARRLFEEEERQTFFLKVVSKDDTTTNLDV